MELHFITCLHHSSNHIEFSDSYFILIYIYTQIRLKQNPFCRRNFALSPFDSRTRHPYSQRQRFKRALCSMMIVIPSYTIDVDRETTRLRKTLQAMRHHFRAPLADLFPLQAEFRHAERSVRYVDHGPGQRFVQRCVSVSEPREARRAAYGGFERAAESEECVFGRVVVVDV